MTTMDTIGEAKDCHDRSNSLLSSKNREVWSRPEFWRKKLPFLDITTKSLEDQSTKQKASSSNSGKKWRQELREQGFSLVDSPIADEDQISKLRNGIEHLQQKLRLPASFILLFDITWKVAAKSKQMLADSTLESNRFQFDILAWFIENDGFSPHRDRQPEGDTTPASFDGEDAKFVTNWIAITEANPQNSCLYMIPKSQDPGYFAGDTEDADPLRVALPSKESYQHIRAMPRQAGQSVMFTHRVIHWGSKRAPNTDLPCRIALSFVCSDPTYEKPYVEPNYFENGQTPPFRIRLLLVCAQMLIYYQRFDLDKEFLKACYGYCKDMEDELEETYRQKVYLEFVKAMKEHQIFDPASKHCAPAASETVDFNDEDADEAMVEEMLNAAKKGYGEFADDYDETFGGDVGGINDDGDEDNAEDPEPDAVLQFAKRPLPVDSNGDGTKRTREER